MPAESLRAHRISGVIALILLGLGSISSTAAALQSSPLAGHPEISVESGRLAGVEEGGVQSFRGIPYAAPPVGELRWRDPRPALAWQGLRDASGFGPVCPQAVRTSGGAGIPGEQSEDCLTLNVWRPKQEGRLPVMVWVHGGGHRRGSGSARLYDGSALAGRGVVVVTFNYRLGLLGSFAHPALSGEHERAGGNWGLADQIAALRWVAANIERFGGDPDRVTVFGQSAGAGSILAILATPSSEGLFSAAILASTAASALELDPAVKREEARDVVALLGLESPNAADLRAVATDQWVWATSQVPGLTMGPFADGDLLPLSPRQALLTGRVHDVPLLVGSTINDGSVLSEFGVEMASLPPGTLAAIVNLSVSDESYRPTLALFTAPAHFIAANTAGGSPSFLYQIDRAAASHGYDVPFSFDNLDRLGLPGDRITPSDRQFARMMADCWVQFARVHRPDCPGLPGWPPIDEGRAMILDNESYLKNAPDPALLALARDIVMEESRP
jgi:para-nitrobenzyl esterase